MCCKKTIPKRFSETIVYGKDCLDREADQKLEPQLDKQQELGETVKSKVDHSLIRGAFLRPRITVPDLSWIRPNWVWARP